MHAIERAVLAQFPSATVSGEPTPHRSGALEVVVGTELVHSKLNGDGYVDSPEKIERMCVVRARRAFVDARTARVDEETRRWRTTARARMD